MHSSLPFLLVLLPGIALAQVDPRTASLSNRLMQGAEPQQRVQAARLLGESEDPEAVPALCMGLADASEEVRVVAAQGLETLKEVSALECLEARKEEGAQAQAALQSALKTLRELKARPPRLYLVLDEVKDTTGLAPELVRATQARLRRSLLLMGAQLATEKESKKAAEATLRKQGLKGYRLMTEIRPGREGGGLMLSVLCMSYPGQKLMGSIQVRAADAEPHELLAALAPQAIEEAKATCSWEMKGGQ